MSHYSLDWRFLLPAFEQETVHVLGGQDTDLSRAFVQAGLHLVELSEADLRDPNRAPLPSLVLPRGLPATGREPEAMFSWIRQLLAPGGFLLVGFDNPWNRDAPDRPHYLASTPGGVKSRLRRAGFRSVRLFGAMPNLAIPEYIFDLDAGAIAFALQTRFRRKPVILSMLRLLGRTAGWQSLAGFLPCYYAVAVA